MFAGFKLETDEMFTEYKNFGETIFKRNKKEIEIEINKFISVDGNINGSEIEEFLFPKVKADIFLSHSHRDRDKAVGLAGFLSKEFGLNVFIDSCVWGYANNFLKQIDDEYCKNDESISYDYDKRNYSTSHVYAMLTTSLIRMIHNTECLFFLSTPNSMIIKDNIYNKTLSPWIYMEIELSNMIERVEPIREIVWTQGMFSQGNVGKSLIIEYDLKTEHLIPITQEHIETWLRICNSDYSSILRRVPQSNHLDVLYKEHKLVNVKRGVSITRKIAWKKIQSIWKRK